MEKEIFFNELSLNNRSKDYKVLTHLRDCYNKLKTFGFTVCRVDAKTRQELLDYLISISGASKQVVTNFFYSFFDSIFNTYETNSIIIIFQADNLVASIMQPF